MKRLPLDGDRRPSVLLQEGHNGTISPDGRWLAYQRTSGRSEVYVRPYSSVAEGQWQVSTEGGTRPTWARSGRELFFLAPDGALMRVAVQATAVTWAASTPIRLFAGPYLVAVGYPQPTYDVAPDGERFLMVKTPTATPNLVIVQNWSEELKQRVPTR
jgi:Tol biopolymer transport system component